VPAGELAGIDVPATDVLGRAAEDLQRRLADAPDWPRRFAVLDEHLGRRLDQTRRPAAEVCHAWRLLRASRGAASVAEIARTVGWSERHLGAQFRIEIGLSPKAAARVIRFDRAKRMLRGRVPGAEVAARCGYFDQSHLVRDFVAFTGVPPGAWFAAEVGNVQVPPVSERAELSA
jgi:AraC-like DNA-binding protein